MLSTCSGLEVINCISDDACRKSSLNLNFTSFKKFKKPLSVFLFLIGCLLGVVAVYMRYVLNRGFRPLLTLVAMLITLGVALFGFGFLGESIQDTNRRLTKLEGTLSKRKEDA